MIKWSCIAALLLTASFSMANEPKNSETTQPAGEDTMKVIPETKAPADLPEQSLYRLKTKTLANEGVALAKYRGKVTLVVNLASKCGFTKQYAGLQKLYEERKDEGFVILGFPSNDFGRQEPGSPEQIREFCSVNYGVTFPLFQKVQTKSGDEQSPIYQNLKAQSGKLPTWNFCKYLVGKDGMVIKFYPSRTKPDDKALRQAIDKALETEG